MLTVTKLSDSLDGACDSDCSLREAIQQANADSTRDEIVLPAGTLRLELFDPTTTPEDANATGDLDILRDLTIRGAGAGLTTIKSFLPISRPDRVIDVFGNGTDVELDDMTISGGVGDLEGGGIRARNDGLLQLNRVVVRDNTVYGQAVLGYGGGVDKESGQLVIQDSALIGNQGTQGGFGGGVFVGTPDTTTASLTNVTIAQNVAGLAGGGIYSGAEDRVDLNFVTITGNEATSSSQNGAGGLDGDLSQFQVRSSVVYGNKAPTHPNCGTTYLPASVGGNVGDPACGLTLATDVQTADALLGPLGGATIPVMEPLPGSPVLDHSVGPCPAADARGLPRPQGAACDAGAAELPVAGGVTPKDTTRPGISNVSITRKRFRVGPNPTALSAARKTPAGTVFRYALSEAAQVTLRIERPTKGRKVGRSCKKATRKLRKKPSCTRYVAAGATIKRNGVAGGNSITFSGRIGRKALRPGSYRATLGATDAAGNKATVRRVNFKVVRR